MAQIKSYFECPMCHAAENPITGLMAHRAGCRYGESMVEAHNREQQISAIHQVVGEFVKERVFQDGKFGTIHKGGGHTIGEWILLIEAELAEAKQALIKGGNGRNSVRSEIIQVGALAMACIEQHGSKEPHSGRQV